MNIVVEAVIDIIVFVEVDVNIVGVVVFAEDMIFVVVDVEVAGLLVDKAPTAEVVVVTVSYE